MDSSFIIKTRLKQGEKLQQAVDDIKEKIGKNIIINASMTNKKTIRKKY